MKLTYKLLSAALLTLTGLLAACAEPPALPVNPGPTPGAPTQPVLPDLEPGTWTAVTPAGETICADGSPYAFFVHPGTVNKVVVDFEGGGACWSDGTCGLSGPFQANLDASSSARYREETPVGLYDRDNPDNPVADWHHVFVSYCTADVHLGDSEQVYDTAQGERTIQHRGQRNVAAVLGWLEESFSAPEAVFVTGCSAGGYGAALYTSQLAELYPEARVTQLGDCGAGIIPEGFAEDGLERWNIAEVLPEGVDLSAGVPATFMADAYIAIGEQHPNVRLAQYNSALDGIQIDFYARMIGADPRDPAVAEAWFAGLVGSLQRIHVDTPNFSSYTSLLDNNDSLQDGTLHCLILRPQLYTLDTSGVSFVAWLDDLLNGAAPPAPVAPPTTELPLS